ncbi:MAG: hypothetical protein SPL07_07520 [Bacteroidales bacterium]|nr:hypothetical protein [Bacteroidales bacterium]
MSYETMKEMIDRQTDYSSANSAYAVGIKAEQNKKLAQAIALEQDQERKRFYDSHNKQIEILENNLKQSEANYKKVNELYELKSKELEDNKEELKQSKKYNKKMLAIALVSAVVATVSLIATIILKFI